MQWRGLLGIVLLVGSIILPVCYIWVQMSRSVYDEHRGTMTVSPGTFESFEFVVFGSFTEIYYQFTVDSGPSVDLYLVTLSDYDRYLAGLPPQDSDSWSHEDVRAVSGSPYPPEARYRAVLDNSDFGVARPAGQQVVVSFELIAGGIPGSNFDAGLFTGLAVFGIALLMFVAGVVILGTGPRSRVPPPAICPFCGATSGRWVCRRCWKLSPPIVPRAYKVKRAHLSSPLSSPSQGEPPAARPPPPP